MALPDFLADLDQMAEQAVSQLSAVNDDEALEACRVKYLGAKQGLLKRIQKGLATVDKADKPLAGKRLNEVKSLLKEAFEQVSSKLALSQQVTGEVHGPRLDTSLPGTAHRIGHLHPLTQTIEDLKEIMGRLGFTVVDGPEIEDEWHNFEALNISPSHPARDPLENFYLAAAQHTAGPMLLRTQTSTVQIRVMEQTKPPVRIISLGRVYRPDTPDATHYPMFQQIEGLLVDRHVTMADLKSMLRLFAGSYFGGDVHIRFRPSFFPFTEPSVEVDMTWGDGWMEMGGAGMVDPHVLSSVGYDPEEYSGFAFGLGVERICARRHNVKDIREFYRNDVRFLHQF